MIEVVRRLIRDGIRPIPIPLRKKAPAILGWQKLVITEENVDQFFDETPSNVGALLGEPSANLQDVDLDCEEAIQLAPHFLPATRTFGRTSRPTSHYLYRAPDLNGEGLRDFKDPFTNKKLIELRSNGNQTVLPGSTHESGEPITWDNGWKLITECSRVSLERQIAELSAACLMLRYWHPSASGGFVATFRFLQWDDEQIEKFLSPLGEIDLEVGPDPYAWREALALPRLPERAEDKEVKDWHRKQSALFEKLSAWLGLPTPPPPHRVARASGGHQALDIKRARAYAAAMPPSISGAGGHAATFAVARKLVQDFALDESGAWGILLEYNARCQPPWSEKELRHKLTEAMKARVSNPVPDRPQHHLRLVPPSDGPPSGSEGGPPPDEPIELIMDGGSPAKCAENIERLLRAHPAWNGGPRLDTFTDTITWPDKIPAPLARLRRASLELADDDEAAVQGWMLDQPFGMRIKASLDTVGAGIRLAARCSTFDSLQQRVESLPAWDGVPRLSKWLVRYAGAEDSKVNEIFGRRWLISCIARALVPGCVADGALVLEGPQGIGKNRLVNSLFGEAPWVQSVGAYRIGHDVEADRIAGCSWIIHDDEMNVRRSEIDSMKKWISLREDTYRPPYGRNVITRKRRAVLVCSTNRHQYLEDERNRRFWPVKCGTIEPDDAARDCPHLLAEALLAYRAGEAWTISVKDGMWSQIDEAQSDRKVRDPIEDNIRNSLKILNNPGEVTVSMLADNLGISPDKIDRSIEMRFGTILRELGFTRKRITVDNNRSYIYRKDK